MKRFILYMFRWQLSSPILYLCVLWLKPYGDLSATIIANIIGSVIFFFVDRFIFTSKSLNPLWEIKTDVICIDCGHRGRGYRIVRLGKYDRVKDKYPEYRCEKCSNIKMEKIMEMYG